jgi:hypothetical protein
MLLTKAENRGKMKIITKRFVGDSYEKEDSGFHIDGALRLFDERGFFRLRRRCKTHARIFRNSAQGSYLHGSRLDNLYVRM